MSALDTLTAAVDAAPSLDAKLATLLDGLAARIKATSNDQNIQKLSRDLAAAAPALVRAVVAAPEPAR